MKRPVPDKAWITGHELAAIAIDIAVGHVFTPPELKWLGTTIGAIGGVLLGRLWRSTAVSRVEGAAESARRSWVSNVIYFVLILLSAVMLWKAVRTWFDRPEQRLTVVAGILFFGAVTAVLVSLWRHERHVRVGPDGEARQAVIFGVCGIAFGLAGGVLMFTGNPVMGFIGLVFFGGAGLRALIRKRVP